MKQANRQTKDRYEEIKQSKKAANQSSGFETEKGREGRSHQEVGPTWWRRLGQTSSRNSAPMKYMDAEHSTQRYGIARCNRFGDGGGSRLRIVN